MTTLANGRTHALKRHCFTIEQYDRMGEAGILGPDDRVELLDGEIVEKPLIGDEHAACVDRLNRKFARGFGDEVRVRIQNPIRLPPHSEPEPDVVLAQPGDRHPEASEIFLVIEVAQTTLATDRGLKLCLYAEAGVPEYWIVDIAGQAVEVYREPTASGYRVKKRLGRGKKLTVAALPGFTLRTDEVLGSRPA